MTKHSADANLDVIIASRREDFFAEVQTLLQGYYLYNLHNAADIDSVMNGPEDFKPVLALVDGRGGTMPTSEWIQGIKMTYPDCPLIALYGAGDTLDFAVLKKNGADFIMHLNYDREFVTDMILKLAPVEMKGTAIPLSALLPIDLQDVESSEPIDFDVYIHLPSNQKSFRVRKSGGRFDEHLLRKAEATQQRLYIKKTQLNRYFSYARNIISLKMDPLAVAMTEKIYHTKELIHEIISEFLNDEGSDFKSGKAIFDRCKQILTELGLTEEKTPEQRLAQIYRFTGYPRSIYQDTISLTVLVSNLAKLLGLNDEKCESIMLAALLHNVGLAQMPPSTFGKSPESFTPDEMQEYQMYPERSVIMIKGKKVPLSTETSTAIVQHQEKADGTGFPHQLESNKIDPLAKILRVSLRYLELTSLNGERPGYTAKAAIQLMKEEAIRGESPVDLVTVNQVVKIFNA
jgi:HD-GYP domain-containing protein (c-di-GMP phosphodiesterase class II)